MSPTRLTPRQQRFVELYCTFLNATEAARQAGYSTKNADKIGHQLLGNPRVKEAIAAIRAQMSDRTQITREWLIDRLLHISNRSLQAEPVLDTRGAPTGTYKFNAAAASQGK